MPIVFSTPNWHLSGVSTFTAHLARRLVQAGIETRILITDPPRNLLYRIPYPESVPVLDLDMGIDVKLRLRCEKVLELLKDEAPCVFIPNYDFDLFGIAEALPPDVGVVGVLHSDDPLYYKQWRRYGQAWNACVCVSQHIADTASHVRPELARRIHVIPYGIPAAGPPSGRLHDENLLRIVYPNLLNQHQKRALDLVGIFRALKRRGVAFQITIAGVGKLEKPLQDALGEFVARGEAVFAGVLTPVEIAGLMERSDVYLLTSNFEGLPLSLLEAMQKGCVPVVSAVASGIPEVVQDGENGCLVPIGDVDGFAGRLARLHADRELLRGLSERAAETLTQKRYRDETMAQCYVELFEQVVAGMTCRESPCRRGRMHFTPRLWPKLVFDNLPFRLRWRARVALSRLWPDFQPPCGARRCCFLCTTWRSGSTFLGHAVLVAADLDLATEHFYLQTQEASLGSVLRGRSLLFYLERLMGCRTNPYGIFGTKVMWRDFEVVLRRLRQLPELRSLTELDALRAVFPKPLFLFLTRADKLRQAISLYRAEASNVWHRYDDGRSYVTPRRAPVEPEYDYAGIRRALERVARADMAWRDFFRRNGIQPLEMTYEAVSASLSGTVGRILEWLGQEVPAERLGRVRSKYVKLADAKTEEWVRRYQRDSRQDL
ncbi:MAG: glycosyltransferase [Acidobacteria bacterium]|nr:glycosyltransferase [Acidobacteriota bacterium]